MGFRSDLKADRVRCPACGLSLWASYTALRRRATLSLVDETLSECLYVDLRCRCGHVTSWLYWVWPLERGGGCGPVLTLPGGEPRRV